MAAKEPHKAPAIAAPVLMPPPSLETGTGDGDGAGLDISSGGDGGGEGSTRGGGGGGAVGDRGRPQSVPMNAELLACRSMHCSQYASSKKSGPHLLNVHIAGCRANFHFTWELQAFRLLGGVHVKAADLRRACSTALAVNCDRREKPASMQGCRWTPGTHVEKHKGAGSNTVA